MKVLVEDQNLREQIVAYLNLTGIEVESDSPVSITLPGAGNTPQKCASGSGKMTAGGKFAPGYDAKLKSSLYAIIRGKPEQVSEELVPNGPMYIPVADWTVEKATEVLRAFGWPDPAPPKPKAEKKEKVEGDDESTNGDGEQATRKGRRKAKAADAEATEAEEPVNV